MEQLSVIEYQIEGMLDDPATSGLVRLLIRIGRPREMIVGLEWACDVEVQPVVPIPMQIYGVSEKQARQLARNFVRSALAGRRAFHGNGEILSI